MIPRIQELFDLTQTEHAEMFEGITYPWEVISLIVEYVEYKVKRSEINADISHATHIGTRVWIGEDTVIEPGVVIQGPAIIGKNCIIRAGTYIRENVIIGDACVIRSELKNCLLFNDVQAPHYNYMGDSVLGYRVHLGGGAALANAKSNKSEITITTLQQTYRTGLKKFGALIGDESEIGAHTVLNPGTIIGKKCVVYPLVSFRGILPSNSIVKLRQQQEIVVRR
ncbi:MAG TPA: DapH/DapD/GlmU-related protein [Patescibacteria group bacterium]|nr:DapH/DapD/GlmU-related protein [Patescibacteria group bacterium]